MCANQSVKSPANGTEVFFALVALDVNSIQSIYSKIEGIDGWQHSSVSSEIAFFWIHVNESKSCLGTFKKSIKRYAFSLGSQA